jgi:hypothetical protein
LNATNELLNLQLDSWTQLDSMISFIDFFYPNIKQLNFFLKKKESRHIGPKKPAQACGPSNLAHAPRPRSFFNFLMGWIFWNIIMNPCK